MADTTGTGTGAVCCGERDWGIAGKALQIGCALCPKSASYWKLPENRADGKPYEPAQPLGG